MAVLRRTRHKISQRRPGFYVQFMALLFAVVVGSVVLLTSIVPEDGSSKQVADDEFRSRLRASLSRFPEDNRSRTVFYNIYIPEGENKTIGLDIVKEQLSLKQRSNELKSAPLYYNLIGSNATDEIQEMCRTQAPDGACHQMGYFEKGDEALTLQSLYDFCHKQPLCPLQQVTYIHNKGSFHPSKKNDKFRYFLNKGVFSADCQRMPLDKCNACATRFSVFPHYHMAGNMWTATCEYIRQLIPPTDFPDRISDLMMFAILNDDRSIPRPTYKQFSDGYPVGAGRYAFEHWIGSHPYMKPCDVYNRKYTHGYRDLPDQSNPWAIMLKEAPRLNMSKFLQISMLRGPWYCGQARLFEYAYLYNGLEPKPDHFIWNYYFETFKGCETPLNWTAHHGMFKDIILRSRTASQ